MIPPAAAAESNKRHVVIDLISDSEDEDEKLPAVPASTPAKRSSPTPDASAPVQEKNPSSSPVVGRKRPLPSTQSEKSQVKMNGQSQESGEPEDSDMNDEDLGAFRGRTFDEQEFNVNDFPTGEEYSSAKERAMATRKLKAPKKEEPICSREARAPATAASIPASHVAVVATAASVSGSARASELASTSSTSMTTSDAAKASVGSASPPQLTANKKVPSSVSAQVPSTNSAVVISSPPDQVPSDQASASNSESTAPTEGNQASAASSTAPDVNGGPTSQVNNTAVAVPVVEIAIPEPRLSLRHDGNCQDQAIELSENDGDDASSSPRKSVRGTLFQARCFQSVVFNERDFVTVRDGLRVARRSSKQSLKTITREPEASPAPESNTKPSDVNATVSDPPAQANDRRSATTSEQDKPMSLHPNTVSQALSVPSTSQIDSDIAPRKPPVVSNNAISQSSVASSSTQSASVAPQSQAVKATPSRNANSNSAQPKITAKPSSAQKITQAALPLSPVQAVSTSESVELSATLQRPPPKPAPSDTTTTDRPSTASVAPEAASTNVLKPRKKKIEFRYLRKSQSAISMPKQSLSQGTKATWTTSAGDVQPSKHSFVKTVRPPALVTIQKPVRLGDCSPEFMQFMQECCENEVPTDEENEEMVRRMQLQLLEVVDLTNLSDSDDRSDVDDSEFMDDSRPTSEDSPPSDITATSSDATEPVAGAQAPAPSTTDSNHALTRAEVALNRRGARPMETCVLCEERRWVKTLQHCAECGKFYHKKCAREYGDESVCWNCELDGIIDDSELTEIARNEVLGMLSTFRHEPVDDSNAESSELINEEDGSAYVDDGNGGERVVAENSSPHPLLSGVQTRSVQRWKAFLEWSTATYDQAFNETTNAITAELQSEQHKIKYTNGFLSREEFSASIGSVLDTYAELQERLDREREQLRQQNLLAAANQSASATLVSSGDGIVGIQGSEVPTAPNQANSDTTNASNAPPATPSQAQPV